MHVGKSARMDTTVNTRLRIESEVKDHLLDLAIRASQEVKGS